MKTSRNLRWHLNMLKRLIKTKQWSKHILISDDLKNNTKLKKIIEEFKKEQKGKNRVNDIKYITALYKESDLLNEG